MEHGSTNLQEGKTGVESLPFSKSKRKSRTKPLVSLKEAVDHAAAGNYEIDFELHGGGEVVDLAKSVQNLTSLLRRKP
jgi:signal transduction histidine kinase